MDANKLVVILSINPFVFLHKEPYDFIIWIIILVILLHSAAISVYLFEWFKNKSLYANTTKFKNKYKVEYLKDTDNSIDNQSVRKYSFFLAITGLKNFRTWAWYSKSWG